MERSNPRKAKGETLDGSELKKLSATYPCLLAHLTDPTWDDGEARTVSTLLLFTENGRWKVCLKDRNANASLWASGEALSEAMAAIEACLALGTGEWRSSKPSF